MKNVLLFTLFLSAGTGYSQSVTLPVSSANVSVYEKGINGQTGTITIACLRYQPGFILYGYCQLISPGVCSGYWWSKK